MLLKNAVVYNEDFEPIRADLAVEGEKIAGIGQVNAGESAWICLGTPSFPA